MLVEQIETALARLEIRLAAAEKKAIASAVSWRVEQTPPVIRELQKPDKVRPDPLRGLYAVDSDGMP